MKKRYLLGFLTACLWGTGMLSAQTAVSDTLKFVFKLHGQTRRYQVVFCQQGENIQMNWGIERNLRWQSGSYTMTPEALKNGKQLCFLQPEDGNHLTLSSLETAYVLPQKALQELKEKIEAEQEQEDFQSKLANEMHEYEQFSIRHFFEQVLEGELCVTEIYDEAAKWSLDLSASCYNLLFLYVQQEKENGSEREMNTFVHLQEEILQYFLRFPQYILFRWNVNCYGVLVKCDAEEMEDYTQRAIAQIQMNCESQNANADWYVVVGTPVERLSMLKECYDRVNHYGAYRFLYPQMHVLSEETLKSYLPAQDDTRIAEVDATKMSPEIISEFLAKGSSKEVYNFVESYLQSISEVIHSVIFRDYVVLNIRFTAIAFMERNGVTKEEFLAHIGKYGTNVHVQQDEVFEYFLSILQTAIDLRDEQNTNLSSKTLKKALAYIDEHYTSENLSLGTVACEVQVGANYLSSVFSQNMQKTFTEYISEKRMEKAKKLLKSTELPTSEIAAQVGYKDPHYFSFVFKKTQGCSPREYRSSI